MDVDIKQLRTAYLIHPYDLAVILNDLPASVPPGYSLHGDGIIEISGELYYQTFAAPQQTKEIV